ncbi:SCO family protein [Agriterribacter sp.]|uniref:SCO family protein n=1 Tax=Agriterribacter sp. TaxID=2821509 RepID=UPI002BA23026|nr:SCO family protein [Agriterribacter sp.]HRO45689.1 SCO family protein [Agriterribacter sp.]HRQ15833.1 SCO family protein [Agriterribacter sp.]
MKYAHLWILPVWLLLSGFNFPNEKKFLAQKAVNIEVFDAAGNSFELFTLLGKKPLIISPVYTRCHSLCGVISNGVQTAITGLGSLGKDFTMVSFSFDSSDKPMNLAAYENRWKMDGINWKTISASAENIQQFMSSIDYQYDYDPATKEFNHPSVLIVLTPGGKISRYIYGINPSKKDIKLAVMEAMAEKTRPGIIKGFYLRCFGYDPVLKTYTIDWRFIISTSAGLLMISLISILFIRSFIVTKDQHG